MTKNNRIVAILRSIVLMPTLGLSDKALARGDSSEYSGYSSGGPALTLAGVPSGFGAASLKPTATAATGTLFPVSATVLSGLAQRGDDHGFN